jgi:hypothetical protein
MSTVKKLAKAYYADFDRHLQDRLHLSPLSTQPTHFPMTTFNQEKIWRVHAKYQLVNLDIPKPSIGPA